jgi:hypothetical protein
MRVAYIICCFYCLFTFKVVAANHIGKAGNWTFQTHKINDSTYDLLFNIELAAGEKLWSNSNNTNDTLVSPSFTFDNNTQVKFIGAIRHQGAHTVTLSNKEPQCSYYSGSVCFYQKVKVLHKAAINGQVGFQVGNKHGNGKPQTVNFAFKLGIT